MLPIAQKDIPKVKELCDLLGFRASSSRPHNFLTDSTHVFRRQYITEDGVPGTELLEWKSPRVRQQLENMAAAFIDDAGYGARHWPANGLPGPRDIPEYPKDRDRIHGLVTETMWRQNQNENRNMNSKGVPSRANSKGLRDMDGQPSSRASARPDPSQMSTFQVNPNPTPRDRNFSDARHASEMQGRDFSGISKYLSEHHDSHCGKKTHSSSGCGQRNQTEMVFEQTSEEPFVNRNKTIYDLESDDDWQSEQRPAKKAKTMTDSPSPFAASVAPMSMSDHSSTKRTIEKKPKGDGLKRRRNASQGPTSDHSSDDGVPRKKKLIPQKPPSIHTRTRTISSAVADVRSEGTIDIPSQSLIGMQEPRKHNPPINEKEYFKRIMPPSVQSSQTRSISPPPLRSGRRNETPNLFCSQDPEYDPSQTQPASDNSPADETDASPVASKEVPGSNQSKTPPSLGNCILGPRRRGSSGTPSPSSPTLQRVLTRQDGSLALAGPPATDSDVVADFARPCPIAAAKRAEAPIPSLPGPEYEAAQAFVDCPNSARELANVRADQTKMPEKPQLLSEASPKAQEQLDKGLSCAQDLAGSPRNVRKASPEAIVSDGQVSGDQPIAPNESVGRSNPILHKTIAVPNTESNSRNDPNSSLRYVTDPPNVLELSAQGAATGAPVDTLRFPPPPAKREHTQKPGVKPRFTIVKSRAPILSKRHWENGSLQGRNVDDIFTEISGLVNRPGIERISFKLLEINPPTEHEYDIARNDQATFEDMRMVFAEDIKARRRINREARFEIVVEPDPVPMADERLNAAEIEDEDDDEEVIL